MLDITEKDIEYYLFRKGYLDEYEHPTFNIHGKEISVCFRKKDSYRFTQGNTSTFTSASFMFLIIDYKKFKHKIFKRHLLTEKYNKQAE